MTTIRPTSVPTKRLASAITSAASSFQLTNIEGWDGVDLTSASFGTKAYGVFRDATNTHIEIFEFDPSTIASSSITILLRGLQFDGNLATEVSGNKRSWTKGTLVELGTHVPQLFRSFVDIYEAQTIDGVKTFSSSPILPTPSGNTDGANKAYVDGVAVAGASNANTTTKGIVEIATQAERDARTATGATGATLVADPTIQRDVLSHDYIASASGTDAYAITCVPAVTAYTTGDVYRFKADVANTGACTLNVNALGAKALKMNSNLDPVDGYIKASAIVECQYDGTNMQILSVSGKPSVSQTGEEIYAADAGANDTYAITLTPAPVAYVTGMLVRFKANTANTGAATLNVNGLGAKTIVKGVSTTLDTNDILASQFVTVMYDGTNFVMQSPTANTFRGITAQGTTTKNIADASTTQNIAHGLGVAPKMYTVHGVNYVAGIFSSALCLNGNSLSGHQTANEYTTFVIGGATTSDYQEGVITTDATNIIITWTKNGSPTGTGNIIWSAMA